MANSSISMSNHSIGGCVDRPSPILEVWKAGSVTRWLWNKAGSRWEALRPRRKAVDGNERKSILGDVCA
jgi:hypothetical protein